ncbi:MAG: RNA polymerase sigma factor [Bryobacteraceae bacterium]
MEQPQEVALARRLMNGDGAAFEPFVEFFRAKVFQYSFLMCGQREDAEEVAQDTLLKVFENFDQLREPERVKPWVFRIARNACYMKRRKSVFAPQEEISLDAVMPEFQQEGGQRKLEVADWSGMPDSRLLQSELRRTLDQAIRELPDLYKSVMLLRDLEELSGEETADILGVSLDVVKTRLHRARLMVRKRMGAYLQHVQTGVSGHASV